MTTEASTKYCVKQTFWAPGPEPAAPKQLISAGTIVILQHMEVHSATFSITGTKEQFTIDNAQAIAVLQQISGDNSHEIK